VEGDAVHPKYKNYSTLGNNYPYKESIDNNTYNDYLIFIVLMYYFFEYSFLILNITEERQNA